MSHICGSVPVLTPYFHVGPDTGEPTYLAKCMGKIADVSRRRRRGTKFVILHFMNVTLPANNRLEVDLGYDTDVFTVGRWGAFWTRPVNVGAVGAGIIIRYITNGAGNGGAFVDRYGRGESLQSVSPGHDSITNCNPFLLNGWVEPNFPHIPGSTAPKYDPFWICNKSAAPEMAECPLRVRQARSADHLAKRRDDRDGPRAERRPSARECQHLFGHADRLGPGRPGGALHFQPSVRGADEFGHLRL